MLDQKAKSMTPTLVETGCSCLYPSRHVSITQGWVEQEKTCRHNISWGIASSADKQVGLYETQSRPVRLNHYSSPLTRCRHGLFHTRVDHGSLSMGGTILAAVPKIRAKHATTHVAHTRPGLKAYTVSGQTFGGCIAYVCVCVCVYRDTVLRTCNEFVPLLDLVQ